MRGLWPLCLALAAAPLPAQVTLLGDTSRPEMSVFAPHEPVELTFTVAGRTAATGPLTLALEVVDVHDRALTSAELTVPAGEGEWTGTWAAPAGALGFYRVRARLSNGVEMAALGTRPAGYLTYAVLPDPATRPEYPAAETFYGMQGGFNDKVNVVPWLGVRWMLGSYDWRRLEPDRRGQFAETHAARGGRQATNPWQVDGQPWVTYPLPTLFMAPPWALTPETAAYVTGSLTPEGETAWVEYCGVAAAAFAAERPELPQRLYQITWEPVYPWGFRGTTAELVRVYELAYPAIHAADPAAVVLGPTGAGISAGDVEWNARLLAAGLGAYIDAFSIHPYHPLPPERNGLVEHVRALREVIRTHLGRDLDCYGTEQGWATNDDPSRELLQAQGLTRAHLIMLGEGFRVNFGFYIADYPAEPGYGYFYNLNPNIPYGTDKMSPKPVAAAFAQQTMLLEGHRSAGAIEWLGDTALGYAYERGPEVTLALWDWGDAPREVSLPVGVEQVVVHDWLGGERAVATPGGTLALTLGPEPRYVVGVAASVWGSTAVRPIELEPSGWSGYPGASITVTGSADTAAEGTLRVELDPRLGPSPAPVPWPAQAAGRAPFSLDLALPAEAELGAYSLRVVLERGGQPVGTAGGLVRLRAPVQVESVAPAAGGLAVTVADTTGAGARGTVAARLRGVPGSAASAAFDLPPGGQAELLLPTAYAGLDPARVVPAEVVVSLAGGYEFRADWPVNFLYAAAGEPTAATPAVELGGRAALVRAPAGYAGAADLAARLRFGWDAEGLWLHADVDDDRHDQPHTGYDTWRGDCLQVGFDLDPGRPVVASGNLFADAGSRHRATEIDLALTPDGPQAYRTISYDPDALPVALLGPDEVHLTATPRAGGVDYVARFAWSALGLAAAPTDGARLGLAVAVNDTDAAGELEPTALGLYGGITPTKDPLQHGVLVLTAAPPVPPALPAAVAAEPELLGQSQTAGEPLPFVGSTGAAWAAGRLWTLAGDTLYGFEPTRAGGWSCTERRALGRGYNGLRFDGRQLWLIDGERGVWTLDPAGGAPADTGLRLAPDPLRGWAVAPADDPRAARVLALGDDGVYGYAPGRGELGLLQALDRPAEATWWYCAVGLEPVSGDLLVGSYWPDSKIYRFTAAGEPVTRDGWPRTGHMAEILVVDGEAWGVDAGGSARPLEPENPTLRLAGLGTMYGNGLARTPDGGWWLAGSQGLLGFDARGRLTGQRLGGLAEPRVLALGAEGTVIAGLEDGGRMVRLALDGAPGGAFASNANEPWRAAGGWSGRAAALAWDDGSFLVADAAEERLWRFDPDHTAWGERPWVALSEPGELPAPRALATGDVWTWFVADGRLLRARWDDLAARTDLTPADWPAGADAIVAMAAWRDEMLAVAGPTWVQAWTVTAAGNLRPAWRREGFTRVAGLALAGGQALISDAGADLVLLGGRTVPLPAPGPIATDGTWAVVWTGGQRGLVRLRVE